MFKCEDCETEVDEEPCEVQGHTPICYECKREYLCKSCYGSGQYSICRDAQGRLDYLHGQPTGEKATCSHCQGEGYHL